MESSGDNRMFRPQRFLTKLQNSLKHWQRVIIPACALQAAKFWMKFAGLLQCAVNVCRVANLFNPDLVLSGRRPLLHGSHLQLVAARGLRHLLHRLLSLVPAFGVKLCDQLAVWSGQLRHHINPALLNHQLHILTGVERKLIRMRLATSQFSLNRLILLEPLNLSVVLPRLVLPWLSWNDGTDGGHADEQYETEMNRK